MFGSVSGEANGEARRVADGVTNMVTSSWHKSNDSASDPNLSYIKGGECP
jgi:hypothetical protein